MPPSLDDVALIGLADEVDVPWLDDPLCSSEAPVLRSAEGESVPCPLLHRVLVALRQERIRHCVLRDPDELVSVPGTSRIDLLVHPGDLERLAGVLDLLGFVPLAPRGRSRCFLAYESEADLWWKLVVTSSASFDRAGRVVGGLARTCLARRQERPPFFVPSPEDELLAVLLRVALEREELTPSRCRQLQELAARVQDPAHLEATLDMLWLPRTDVRAFLRRIHEGDWTELLAEREVVARRLRSRAPLRARLRRLAARLLRPLGRRLGRTLPGALAVAVSSSTGSSPLGRELSRRLYGGVCWIDVGPCPRPEDRVGRVVSRALHLARRFRWCLQARWQRRCGRFVVLDRYPHRTQLGAAKPSRRQRLWRRLEARSCPRPDLVLILASPEEAARSGEAELASAHEGPPPRSGRPPAPESARLDAIQDPQQMLREALACIWGALQRRRRGELPR